ncbi:unnamed protein product, partial [Closterium sp. Naga37s-1]
GAPGAFASTRGLLVKQTGIIYEAAAGSGIKVVNQMRAGGGKAAALFKQKDFNFEKLGIGGLDAQFADIFRRAFASRVFPPHIISRLGITHVKGMLLHVHLGGSVFGAAGVAAGGGAVVSGACPSLPSPNGTGKTLIAQQIGKLLNGMEPKVVNGPEILDKYVGAAEKNIHDASGQVCGSSREDIRDLFADAEKDQKEHGDESDLHIIIFDEIDAICKSRGSVRDGTGVHDSIVNQLLTKIDGVESLNNILLIGMTNRKDMLDEALLRPGRLEVQIEIGLPDEEGRVKILAIHSNKMRENSFMGADVDLNSLAARTKNFSGAELEGLVKSAVFFALSRQTDPSDLTKAIDEDNIRSQCPLPVLSSNSFSLSFLLTSARTKNFSGAELEGLVKSAVSFALSRQTDPSDLTKAIDEDNIRVTYVLPPIPPLCRPLPPSQLPATKNFSGAELEGLVKSAVSFALSRQTDPSDLTKAIDEDNIPPVPPLPLSPSFHSAARTKNFSGAELEGLVKNLTKAIDEDNIRVTMVAFEEALKEVRAGVRCQHRAAQHVPVSGWVAPSLATCAIRSLNGMLQSLTVHHHILSTAKRQVLQVKARAAHPAHNPLFLPFPPSLAPTTTFSPPPSARCAASAEQRENAPADVPAGGVAREVSVGGLGDRGEWDCKYA